MLKNYSAGRKIYIWVAKKYIFGTYTFRMNLIQRVFNRSMSGASNARSVRYFQPLFASLRYMKVDNFIKNTLHIMNDLAIVEINFCRF